MGKVEVVEPMLSASMRLEKNFGKKNEKTMGKWSGIDWYICLQVTQKRYPTSEMIQNVVFAHVLSFQWTLSIRPTIPVLNF